MTRFVCECGLRRPTWYPRETQFPTIFGGNLAANYGAAIVVPNLIGADLMVAQMVFENRWSQTLRPAGLRYRFKRYGPMRTPIHEVRPA